MAILNAPIAGGTLRGTSAADTINGSATADVLWGLGGDDIINGGDGNDVIEGDGTATSTLADSISALGSYVVPLNSQPNKSNRPELKFLGNTSDNKTVWGIFNTTNQAMTVTIQGIRDYKLTTGHVPYGPVTYVVPANSELFVASPSSLTHDISYNGVHVADADPHQSQPFNNPLVVSAASIDGDDVLSGGNGNDTIRGYGGDDVLNGDAGDDSLDGGTGNDILTGGVGADKLIGGDGIDGANYSNSTAAVTVNLALGAGVGGDAQGDTLTGIENLIGSKFNDTLTGDANANTLDGGTGDDILAGGAGADKFIGGDGADTLDYGTSGAAVNVNLKTGAAAGGDAAGDNFAGIENITGSKFNDVLTGDAGANTLRGGAGDDTLVGGAGADVLNGGDGSDTADYSASSAAVNVNLFTGIATGGDAQGDTLISIENVIGSAFDNVIAGNAIANILSGGAGVDTLDYANSTAGVSVNLSSNVVSGGFAQGDTISGFENVTGSAFNDVLVGGAGANTLLGGAGADTLVGGAGADVLNGGDGPDTADYSGSSAAVNANLFTGFATGGDAQGDTFSSIENLTGSNFNDTLVGDAAINILTGGKGNDVLAGGAGADTLVGGDGIDTADYSTSQGCVTVNLLAGTGKGCDAEGDKLISIENVIGSKYNDTLTGDAGANNLFGALGNDHFYGSGGGDRFDGGAGKDWIDYRNSSAGVNVNLVTGAGQGGLAQGDIYTGIENIRGSAGDDTLIGDINANVIYGGKGADHMEGGGGNDMIYSGGGYDYIDGGAGIDTLSYSDSWDKVIVNLQTGVGQYGAASRDTIINIENLVGSKFDDTLTGDAGNNVLNGAVGNDILHGGLGADTLVGGAGKDVLDGGEGIDIANYANSHIGVTLSLITGGALNVDASQNGVMPIIVEADNCPDDQVNDGNGTTYIDPSYTAINGVTDATGDKYVGIENVVGSAFNDKISGDDGANRLNGGAGNDMLNGAGGIDYLVGDAGNDTLIGGSGADVFVFDAHFGNDTITDFWAGVGRTDRASLTNTDLHSFVDVLSHVVENASGVVLSVNSGLDTITFAGLHVNQLHADDFLF
jgi:Ca2+-binding RTX toxin-like protein